MVMHHSQQGESNWYPPEQIGQDDGQSTVEGINEESLCRLGYCVKETVHYRGGDHAVMDKLRNGICPICGGPTEKKYTG